jgi:hypothetical protein
MGEVRSPIFSISAPTRKPGDPFSTRKALIDEDLAAVEDVAVAAFLHRRREAIRVGARARLRHGVAADELAAAEPGQVALLLLLGSKGQDRSDRGPHVRVDGEDEAVVLAAIAEAFQHAHGGERVEPHPSVLGGDVKPVDPEFGQLPPAREVELAGPVPRQESSIQLALRQADDRLAHLDLLLRPGQIHRSRPEGRAPAFQPSSSSVW